MEQELKILFYNTQLILPLYNDYIRANKLRTFLLEGDWDVIGLCEVYVPPLRKILVEDADLKEKYPYHMINHDGEGAKWIHSGLVLLSKYPINKCKRVVYKNQLKLRGLIPWNFFTKRDLYFASIQVKHREVGVFLTHLQYGYDDRRTKMRHAQIRELREIMQDNWDMEKPIILMGDFNIKANSYEYDILSSTFNDLYDWWPSTNEDEGITYAIENTRNIFLPENTRLDYIFSNGGVKPISANILEPNWTIDETEWKSTKRLAIHEYIVMKLMWIMRWIDIPYSYLKKKLLKWKNFPEKVYRIPDLSDHYAIEGVSTVPL